MDEKIIDFVRENRFLYDKKHTMYRNQNEKDKKWMELSNVLNVPVDTVKKRWKTMRDRFYRVRKSDLSTPSGRGKSSPKKGTSYKYNKFLQFLDDVEMSNKRTTENFDQFEEENMIKSELNFHVEEVNCSRYSESETLCSSPTTSGKQECNELENDILDELETSNTSTQKVTPFRVFLESVALMVEKTNLNLSQINILQIEILRALQNKINEDA